MPKYWLIGGATFVGVLLVASVVVALMQEDVALKEGSPERAVQLYLQAVRDEDFKAAHGFLSEELKKDCTVETMAARDFGRGRELSSSRVTLRDTTYLNDSNDSALVIARVTRVRGSGPFGSSESSHEQRYVLSLEDGQWLLAESPWPYYGCPEPSPKQEAIPAREPPPTPTPAP